MTVEELIEYLKSQDPKAQVGITIWDGDYTDWYTFSPNVNSEAIPGYLDLGHERVTS